MKELTVAKRASREAGKLLLSHFGNLKNIRYKSTRRDPVSEADEASEALVAGLIKDAFPTHGFLGEEKTAWRGEGGRWIVDPLDGTVNFAHGYPAFCVSIAYEEDGEVMVGVVHDPVRRETFTATRGGGAYLNGKPIRVSNETKLSKSLLATGFPYNLDEIHGRVLGLFNAMALASQGIRRGGSAALDLCWLACGRVDGFWELELKPWDTAAGAVIVREAGGVVTDFSGARHRPEMKEILASNGKIQKQMRTALNDAGR